jgi:hypothetical protein
MSETIPADLMAALRTLDAEHVGDFAYDLRERVNLHDLKPGQSSWEHPRVVAWGKAAATITRYVKASITPSTTNEDK